MHFLRHMIYLSHLGGMYYMPFSHSGNHLIYTAQWSEGVRKLNCVFISYKYILSSTKDQNFLYSRCCIYVLAFWWLLAASFALSS